jgi:hypothetical protein
MILNKSETAFLKTVRRKRKTPPDPRSESQKRITNKGINARVKKTRVLSLGKTYCRFLAALGTDVLDIDAPYGRQAGLPACGSPHPEAFPSPKGQ